VIESGTNSPEIVDIPIAGFAGGRDLVVECEVSVQEEAEVACRRNRFYDCGRVYFQ
jgi:hypothetical protein